MARAEKSQSNKRFSKVAVFVSLPPRCKYKQGIWVVLIHMGEFCGMLTCSRSEKKGLFTVRDRPSNTIGRKHFLIYQSHCCGAVGHERQINAWLRFQPFLDCLPRSKHCGKWLDGFAAVAWRKRKTKNIKSWNRKVNKVNSWTEWQKWSPWSYLELALTFNYLVTGYSIQG